MLILIAVLIFASLPCAYGQQPDAPVHLLLEAMRKLADSDLLITSLKSDIEILKQTISSLSADSNHWRQSTNELSRINQQQRIELELTLINYQKQQEVSASQSQEYQATIQRLSDLYNNTLTQSAIKEQTIEKLTTRNGIFLIWAIIATAAITLLIAIKLCRREK